MSAGQGAQAARIADTILSPEEIEAAAQEAAVQFALIPARLDTYTPLAQQNGNMPVLPTHWGPMFYYVIHAKKDVNEVADGVVQHAAVPHTYKLSLVLPPGIEYRHYMDALAFIRATALRLGAPKGHKTIEQHQEQDPTTGATVPSSVPKFSEGSSLKPVFRMITLDWSADDHAKSG